MKYFIFGPLIALLIHWGWIQAPPTLVPLPPAITTTTTPLATTTHATTTRASTKPPTPAKSPVAPQKTVPKAPAPRPEPSSTVPTTTPAVQSVQNASAPTTTPVSPPVPAQISYIPLVESAVLALSNAERTQEGLSSLASDTALADIARAHSADMLARSYFSHTDPAGCGSSCRANAAGYGWRAIGENIYMSEGFDVPAPKHAQMVVDGWMNSPGHRANILGAQYSHMGIGIAQKGDAIYVTALYAKPR